MDFLLHLIEQCLAFMDVSIVFISLFGFFFQKKELTNGPFFYSRLESYRFVHSQTKKHYTRNRC